MKCGPWPTLQTRTSLGTNCNSRRKACFKSSWTWSIEKVLSSLSFLTSCPSLSFLKRSFPTIHGSHLLGSKRLRYQPETLDWVIFSTRFLCCSFAVADLVLSKTLGIADSGTGHPSILSPSIIPHTTESVVQTTLAPTGGQPQGCRVSRKLGQRSTR